MTILWKGMKSSSSIYIRSCYRGSTTSRSRVCLFPAKVLWYTLWNFNWASQEAILFHWSFIGEVNIMPLAVLVLDCFPYSSMVRTAFASREADNWVQIRSSGVKNQNLHCGHWGSQADNDHFLCQKLRLTINTLCIEIIDAIFKRLLRPEKADFPSSSLAMLYDSKPNTSNLMWQELKLDLGGFGNIWLLVNTQHVLVKS